MNFIGVDLHKKSITLCVMDEKPQGPGPQDRPLRPARPDRRVLPPVPPLQGGHRGHRQLPLVRRVAGAPGREDRAGQPQEAPGDRREHQEDRPPRRPGPGRVPGPRHDPPGLHAHAQAAAAPGPGPPPPVSPGADDLGAVQDPPRPGRLQRGPQGPLLGPVRQGLLQAGRAQRRRPAS